ncbi:MAG: type II secretion system protein [Pseudomonadota bacterium]
MLKKKAFTLIEMIIVITVLSIVAMISANVMYQAFQGTFAQYDLGTVDSQARVILVKMTSEIRTIRSNATSDLILGANTITFTDVLGNTITYSLSGNTLMRNAQPLADSVTSLAFSYYNASHNVTATSTEVRYITVTIGMTVEAQSIVLKTTIFPRNF